MAGPEVDRGVSLGHAVNHLARCLAQGLRLRIAPLGVVPGQFAQLLALYERDGMTQAELCAELRVEQPTMANTLARMERDGLVTRAADPRDGRRQHVRLTPRARALEHRLVAAVRAGNAVATRGLTDRQVADFLDVLGRMVVNLEQDAGAPSPPATPSRTPLSTPETPEERP